MSTVAEVRLWGRTIGAVSVEEGSDVAAFQYDAYFLRSGIEIAPIHVPLSSTAYRFPSLNRESFHGLPGLLADSLPDRYGTALINAWLAGQGRSPDSANAVEAVLHGPPRHRRVGVRARPRARAVAVRRHPDRRAGHARLPGAV